MLRRNSACTWSRSTCIRISCRTRPTTPIGAVFANAGVTFNHTILRSTLEEWQATLNVNVIGVVNRIQAFVPTLQAQSTPSVFCATASVGGLVRGDGGAAAYQASKHAVVALSESLSFELARRDPQLRVHVLCPCIVASGLGRTSVTNEGAPAVNSTPMPSRPPNLSPTASRCVPSTTPGRCST